MNKNALYNQINDFHDNGEIYDKDTMTRAVKYSMPSGIINLQNQKGV